MCAFMICECAIIWIWTRLCIASKRGKRKEKCRNEQNRSKKRETTYATFFLKKKKKTRKKPKKREKTHFQYRSKWNRIKPSLKKNNTLIEECQWAIFLTDSWISFLYRYIVTKFMYGWKENAPTPKDNDIE